MDLVGAGGDTAGAGANQNAAVIALKILQRMFPYLG
jgi:hypothetical protein